MKCFNCGTENIDIASYCVKCGTHLANNTPPTQNVNNPVNTPDMVNMPPKMNTANKVSAKPKKKSKTGLIVALITTAIVVIISLIVGGFFLARSFMENNDKPVDNAAESQTVDEADEKVESGFSNIAHYNGKMYYWRYNDDSIEDSALFGNYNYANDENDLICNDNGNETVLITDDAGGMLVAANNRIFYTDGEDTTCFSLESKDIESSFSGVLIGATSGNDKIIIDDEDTGIVSVDTKSLTEAKLTDEGASFIAADNKNIYYETFDYDDEDFHKGKTRLYSVSADGNGKAVLINETKPDLYDFTDGVCLIFNAKILDDCIYYCYGAISGTGMYYQGGNVVKAKLDGSGAEILCKTDTFNFYIDKSGGAVFGENGPSSLIGEGADISMTRPCYDGNIKIYDADARSMVTVVTKEEIEGMCDGIYTYSPEDFSVTLSFAEKCGDNVYFMLSKGERDSKNDIGWRESYKRICTTLFVKNMTDGSLREIYTIGDIAKTTTSDYSNLAGSYVFSSGAGAWGTSLEVNEDMTFTGEYHDSDMGSTGKLYPNGTVYVCEFSGKIDSVSEIDSQTLLLKLSPLSFNHKEITEYKDGIKYVYTKSPYGLDDATELYFYKKGTSTDDFSPEFLSWIYDVGSTFESDVIRNPEHDYAFVKAEG